MIYRFYCKRDDKCFMTERHSHSRIEYYSKQKMDELYPDSGYEVIGEISNFTKKYVSQDAIETNTGKSIPIFPRGSLKKPFEWVVGYAAVGENTYVAVVKSVIPHLVWHLSPSRKIDIKKSLGGSMKR